MAKRSGLPTAAARSPVAGHQQTNATDLIELAYDLIAGMPALELLLALNHVLLVKTDIRQNDMQLMTQRRNLETLN